MDLGAFLDHLKGEDLLITIDEEFDPRYEISAVLKALGNKSESPEVF